MSISVPIRRFIIVILFCALVTTVSAASYIQLFVHPGSGTVCLDDTCRVNVGTLDGYSSSQFQDLTCGMDHAIRVYNTPGYEDYTDTVYMDSNCHSVTRRIYLEPVPAAAPVPATGDIQVYVSPGLGQVCRDNQECEVSTGPAADTWSVRFSDVSSDVPHTITVTADGYEPAAEQVSVSAGGIAPVEIRLVPLAGASGAEPAGQPAAPPATASAPVTKATASPLGFEVVFIAIGSAGVLAVCRKQLR